MLARPAAVNGRCNFAQMSSRIQTSIDRLSSVLPRMTPMRLLGIPQPLDHPDLIYELKYDGFRGLAYINGHHAKLVSRNGHTFKHWQYLCTELAHAVCCDDAILDGEIGCLAADGRLRIRTLLFRREWPLARRPPGSNVVRQRRIHPVCFQTENPLTAPRLHCTRLPRAAAICDAPALAEYDDARRPVLPGSAGLSRAFLVALRGLPPRGVPILAVRRCSRSGFISVAVRAASNHPQRLCDEFQPSPARLPHQYPPAFSLQATTPVSHSPHRSAPDTQTQVMSGCRFASALHAAELVRTRGRRLGSDSAANTRSPVLRSQQDRLDSAPAHE